MTRHRWMSPTTTVLVVWSTVIVGSHLAPEGLLCQVWGSTRLLTSQGAFVLFCMVASFVLGATVHSGAMTSGSGGSAIDVPVPYIAAGLKLVNLLLIGVGGLFLIWVGRTVTHIGKLSRLQGYFSGRRLAPGLRSVFDANKPFSGAETIVISVVALLIVCGSFKGYLVRYDAARKGYSRGLHRRLNRSLLVCVVLLLCYAVFAAARVFVLTGVLSAFGGFALSSNRHWSAYVRFGVLLAVFLVGFWVYTQVSAYGNPFELGIAESLETAAERLWFYFAINVRNFNTVVTRMNERTWGAGTLSGILRLPGIHHLIGRSGVLEYAAKEWQQHIVSGAGTVPAFGVLYRDFGALALPLAFVLGFVCEALFRTRLSSPFRLQAYAYVWSGLIFSYQALYHTNRSFLWNVFLLWAIHRYAGATSRRSAHPSVDTGVDKQVQGQLGGRSY